MQKTSKTLEKTMRSWKQKLMKKSKIKKFDEN